MANKKYEFTGATLTIEDGIVLHQIRALRDIRPVKAGEVGGWIASEYNLSQHGESWIFENSVVYDDAVVSGDATVLGSSVIRGENVRIMDGACVKDSKVEGQAVHIMGTAFVSGNCHIDGQDCYIQNNAVISGNSEILGCVTVRDYARVENFATVNALNFPALIEDVVSVTDYASVVCISEPVRVCGYARIKDGSVVRSERDYMCFKDCISNDESITWTRFDDKWACGGFHGTATELLEYGRAAGVEYEAYYAAFIELVEKIKNLPISNLSNKEEDI